MRLIPSGTLAAIGLAYNKLAAIHVPSGFDLAFQCGILIAATLLILAAFKKPTK